MSFLNTAVATAYDCRAVWHPVRHARKSRNAQKVRGFRASGTYGHCIKDHVLIDPACGSGNFLTETYLCLRKLEDKVLDELQFGQLQWSVAEEEEAGERISLSQFHGIEINDFAVSVAETALYISRLKANNDTMMLLDFHNAWMRAVAGRLESRYRYSNIIVYNNFVWPEPTEENRKVVENCAKAVLDARNKHHTDSLANLYDPDKMPDDLLDAHKSLDAAVEAAYGVSFQGDEEKIIAHMFKLYEKAVSKEKGSKAPANKNVSSERELKVSPHAVKVKVKVKSDRSDS